MTEPTSVRPDQLAWFADVSRDVVAHLASRSGAVRRSVEAFLGGTDAGLTTTNPGLIGAQLTGARTRIEDTERFVRLLRTAVLAADVHGGDVATLTDAEMFAALSTEDRAALAALLTPEPVPEVDPPTAGVIPRDSGFVDDPVCTATGHFLEDERDLVVPERLAHLGWARRYSSRQLDDGPFGPGWWTWASASCRLVDDVVALVCPDGRHIRFPRPAPGGWAGTLGADVTVHLEDDAVVVRWGPRAPEAGETWRFDPSGRIRLVASDRGGTTTFTHDGDRLVGLTHEGGRSLALVWADDRVVGLRAGDGRSVSYGYAPRDQGGHLVHVERPSGAMEHRTDTAGRIVEVVDADGVSLVRNRYDELGRVVRQVAPTGRVTVFRYEPGRRTAVCDGAGDVLALYVHDRLGRVETLVSPQGPSVTRRFDDDGVVVEQRGADGAGFVVVPDGDDGLRVEHADGVVEVLRRDHLGRVVEHHDPRTGSRTLRWDGDTTRLASVTQADGGTATLAWSASGALAGIVDADGVGVTVEPDDDGLPRVGIDGLGRRTEIIARHASGVPTSVRLPDGGTVRVEVDDAGRVTALTDPSGAQLTMGHTPAGRLARIDDPSSGALTLEWGADGMLAATVDGDGRRQEVAHDEWGRPVRVTGTDGGAWTLTWSALGVLTSLTTPAGASWQVDLDDVHRPRATTDPLGATTSTVTDDLGRLSDVVSAARTLHVDHDELGRRAATTTGLGARTAVDRDVRSRVVEVQDPDGHRTRRMLSSAGRVTAVADGVVTRTVAYDAAGAVAAVALRSDRDALGADPATVPADDERTWTVETDWRGLETAITTPEGRTRRIGRDALGRVTTVDVAGAIEARTIDRRGLLAEHLLPTGTRLRFDHDERGRLAGVCLPDDAHVAFGYDAADRLVTRTDPFGGTVRLDHDEDGHVVARTDALVRTTTFERAADGSLVAVVDPDGRRVDTELDAAGRVVAVRADGAVVARYGYDADGHLVTVDEPAARRERTLTRTPAGRLAALEETGDGRSTRTDWFHDPATVRCTGALPSRRLTADIDGVTGDIAGVDAALRTDRDGLLRHVAIGDATLDATLDEAGRIAEVVVADARGRRRVLVTRDLGGRVVRTDDADAVTTYGYDDVDRLASTASATASGGTTGTTWRHDAAGRPVTIARDGATTSLAYDEGHQVVAAETPAGTVRFTYDGAGRRVLERHPDGTERRFVWDALGRLTAVVDDGVVLDVDIDCFGLLRRVGDGTLDWDLSGHEPALAAVNGRAVWSLGRVPIAVAEPDGGFALLPAAIGGPALRQGGWPAGAGTDRLDPTVELDCGVPGGIGFAGLIWLGDRILDPATGQFLTPDPLEGRPGAPTSCFPYAYADGDPVNRMDPTGRNGQPISIEDFTEMRDRATGARWGNIATVAGVIVVGALVVSGVGVPVLIAAGALAGAAQGAGMAHQAGASTSGIIGAAVVGGVAGAAMGMIPGVPALGTAARTAGARAAMGASVGAVNGAAQADITGQHVGNGALGGALAGGLGGAATMIPVGSSAMVTDAAVGGGIGTVEEIATSYLLPGGDGRFDPARPLLGVGGGLITGAATDTFGSGPMSSVGADGPAPLHAPGPSALSSTTTALPTAGATTATGLPTPGVTTATSTGPAPAVPSAGLWLPEPMPGWSRTPSGLLVPR